MTILAKRPDRRAFLQANLAAATSLGLGIGCGSSNAKPQNELNVFVYAGGHEATMRQEFVPAFEAATGARVVLHPGWWEGIAKLKAAGSGPAPFDLMITDATQGYPAIEEGLFQAIDLDRVPNHKLQYAPTLDNAVVQRKMGITYPDSVMTLAYHKTRVKEAPRSWGDLLKEPLAGNIGLYNSFYLSLFTFACMWADLEAKPGTAHERIRNNLEGVFDFARRHRDRVKLWWPTSSDMILALVNRDCDAGNMHSPEYIQALREKPELGAVVPEADRAFVQVFWTIPRGAAQVDLAHQALDLLFSPAMQLAFARKGSATANLSVAKTMANEDPFWRQIYPHTAEQFATLRYYPYEVYAKSWKEIGETWDRTVLRHG